MGNRPPPPIDAPLIDPTWTQRFRVLRNIPPFLKLVWSTHRGYVVGVMFLRVVRGALPVAALWIGKLVIDLIVASVQSGDVDWRTLVLLVLAEFALAVVGETSARLGTLWESLLGDLFVNEISVRLMRHADQLDLSYFEDPDFYDQLERARRQTNGRLRLLVQLLALAQDIVALLVLGGALLVLSPLLFALLVGAVVPLLMGEAHYASLGYSLLYRWTPGRRQLDYYRLVAASKETAKEVKIFQVGQYLIEQYQVLANRFFAENRTLAASRTWAGIALSLLSQAGYFAAYGTILVRTVRGVFSVGDLAFLTGSFRRAQEVVQRVVLGTTDLYDQALFLDDLFAFLRIQPRCVEQGRTALPPRRAAHGIEFCDVWFRYGQPDAHAVELDPDSVSWVLRGMSFRVEPGERVAFVGTNGAGKTTIVKLMLHLYEPLRGQILLDDRPLASYKPSDLRRAFAVVFQDFVRWDMTASTNIAIGSNTVLGRGDAYETALMIAAERARASEVIAKLPQGYETMLGRRFAGGIELSGGDWQKIALARAYVRDAEILILDEPTAALDARAEYEVFQRFSDLAEGKTAIIISHRFSTVRMADRIIVVDNGTVLEEGTHEHLVHRGGRYAELFELQAAGYR